MVTSELDLERNADLPGSDLFLDGEELKLFRVYVRGSDGKVAQLEVSYPCRADVAFYVALDRRDCLALLVDLGQPQRRRTNNKQVVHAGASF